SFGNQKTFRPSAVWKPEQKTGALVGDEFKSGGRRFVGAPKSLGHDDACPSNRNPVFVSRHFAYLADSFCYPWTSWRTRSSNATMPIDRWRAFTTAARPMRAARRRRTTR